jgi:NADH dehydrogenase
MRLSGWPAWLISILIHLVNILQFRNRLLVLLQWGWLYATYDRSARLITGRKPLPLDL